MTKNNLDFSVDVRYADETRVEAICRVGLNGRHVKLHIRRPLYKCQCVECLKRSGTEVARDHHAINRVMSGLDEKSRREFAGLLALQQGCGGLLLVHRITGLSRTTILRGQVEVADSRSMNSMNSIRKAGGGRKLVEKNKQGY